MAKLYPPIINGTLPAFTKQGGLIIPYEMNRAVGYNDIAGFSLVIKSTVTNKVLVNGEVLNKVSSGEINFTYKDEWNLHSGGFYKVQIAFLDKTNQTPGHYSNVGIVKFIGDAPILQIDDNTAKNNSFIGSYQCNDITEKVYSYKFDLYSSKGELVESSGDLLHNASKDLGIVQYDSWIPKKGLNNGENYNLTFSVVTMNDYHVSTTKIITAKKDEQGYSPKGLLLEASYNNENAYVSLSLKSAYQNDLKSIMYGKFEIFKLSSKDNFQSKYRIAYFSLENQDLFEKTFRDFSVESGYRYKYIMQQINDYGIYSEEIYSNEVVVSYEHLYLYDGEKQLKIKFNPKVSSFKDTLLESKMNTIGSKYPFVFKNNMVQFKEFQISGLISYQMDEENLFIKNEEIWSNLDIEDESSVRNDQSGWTHNLTAESIQAEKVFKNKVMDWLNNGEPKLFKSPTEGNYIIRLMTISLTPNDQVGRMLHTFNASAFEIDDVETYEFAKELTIDKIKKYIGYRTTPLYNFPLKKIAQKVVRDNGKLTYVVVNNNNLYEIIGNMALEYVVAARFEDIKPGTQFQILLERGIEQYSLNITIGATGFYRIDRDLGFHIRSIKLVKPEWATGDYWFDLMNNRGQVTYEYERKAQHNNFNDITKINASVAVSAPWYPIVFTAYQQEPILNAEGRPLYSYELENYQDAYVEIAYFLEKYEIIDERLKKVRLLPCINGIDYTYENKSEDVNATLKYYDKTVPTQELHLFIPDQTLEIEINNEKYSIVEDKWFNSCSYGINDKVYKYKKAEQLLYTGDGVLQNDNIIDKRKFSWIQQSAGTKVLNDMKYYIQHYPIDLTDSYVYYPKTGFVPYATYIKDLDNKLINFTEQELINSYGYYTLYPNNNALQQANLFIHDTNSQGMFLTEEVQGTYKRNPYYVRAEYVIANNSDSDVDKAAIEADIYKLTPLKTDSLYTRGENDYSQNGMIDTYPVYKNYVGNKYYNVTNVNGEYYNKEDIINLYDLNFELIQVFYQEDLTDTQNFTANGNIWYEDILEDAGYQRTNRYIDNSSLTNVNDRFLNTDLLLQDDELFADSILLGRNKAEEELIQDSSYLTILKISNNEVPGVTSTNIDTVLGIYNYTGEKKNYNSLEFWVNDVKADLFTLKQVDKILVDQGYFMQKIDINKYKNSDGTLKTSELQQLEPVLNIRNQAATNYSKMTTPGPNEIIIIHTNSLNNPVKIDLTNRLSYHFSIEDYEDGYRDLAGIYLGTNVRGFATYKRKIYDYKALAADGVYIDLVSQKEG